MIGYIRGTLVAKNPPFLLVDVQGIGYESQAPMTTFYKLPEVGATVQLHTHLLVREDAHTLFSFVDLADRVMFRSLIKVNGVGAKLALAILSGQSAEEFHNCIHNNDIQALVRLPGIGKKTAERLIVEMGDRLPENIQSSKTSPAQNPKQEAISALCALGYKPQDAGKMVGNISANDKSCEDIIKLALQTVASK